MLSPRTMLLFRGEDTPSVGCIETKAITIIKWWWRFCVELWCVLLREILCFSLRSHDGELLAFSPLGSFLYGGFLKAPR